MMEVSLLTPEYSSLILEMEEQLIGNPAIVIPSTYEEVCKCLESESSWGLFIDDQLVSYSLCYYDEYGVIAYIEKCVTLDSHRGQGYQRLTIRKCLASAQLKGAVSAYATVGPTNIASLTNFKRCGFVPLRQEENMFNSGYPRIVLGCKL